MIGLASIALACAGSPVSPANAPVTGEVRVEPARFAPGDTAVITVELTNARPHPVTIEFPSTCQFGFEVEAADGNIVAPVGIGCGQLITYRELGPREMVRTAFSWVGDTGLGAGDLLPPGTYRVYGGLGIGRLERKTPAAVVELLPG